MSTNTLRLTPAVAWTIVIAAALLGSCKSGTSNTQWDVGDGSGEVGADSGDAAVDADSTDGATDADVADLADSDDVPIDADVDDVPDPDAAGDVDAATDADAADADVDDIGTPDADVGDIGDGSANACGGEGALLWDGVAGEPGGACGCGGTLACDGLEALTCVDSSPVDACGGCGDASVELGDPCDACGTGAWGCSEDGELTCVEGEVVENACGGCTVLDGAPGDVCSEDGVAGLLVCAGTDALACRTATDNACGGTAALDALPGQACGDCNAGAWVCDGIDAVVCAGDADARNACGGCGLLAEVPGDACGACGGAWVCDGEDAVACADPERNTCGGCAVLEGEPGEACGVGGAWYCATTESVACGSSDANACGGTAVLSGAPGEACGACGDGYFRCVSPDELGCVGEAGTNACGGCAALPGVPGESCGRYQEWVCTEDGGLQCVLDGTEGVIGPDGGTISLPGEIVVTIPPGAVSEPTLFSIERTDITCVPGFALGSPVYRVLPDMAFAVDVSAAVVSGMIGGVVYYDNVDGFVSGGGLLDGEGSVVGTMPELGLVFVGTVQAVEICGNLCDDEADGDVDCADAECIVACGGCVTNEDCGDGFVCVESACVAAPDPCDGVVCDTPPGPTCEGAVLVEFGTPGRCADGLCVEYPRVETDCTLTGAICFEGACVPVVDPCAAVICNEPPADTCDGVDAVRYGAGLCTAGTCSYEPVTVPCDAGEICVDAGLCVPLDPCLGVVCDAGPDIRFCEGSVAVEFGAVGECFAGECEYPTLEEDCALSGRVCDGGVCLDVDPCAGVDCSTPPADFCTGDVATRYTGGGTCTDGTCGGYPSTTEDCAATGRVCEGAGVCVDPCEGVVCDNPPADFCEGNTATRYSGACADGDCVYTPTSTPCAANELCQGAGLCVVNPCFGVDCSTPPADFCTGDVATRYTGGGACTDGTCGGYPSTTEDCAATGRVCEGAGVCADPCEGVVCDNPPADFCAGNTATRYSGACADGDCVYTPTSTPCAANETCQGAGVCVVNPCFGVDCSTPPADFCTGDVATRYTGGGECTDGTCGGYPSTTEDCAATGRVCEGAGVCADPCEGVVCDNPPADFCAGNTATRFSGACEGGDCVYTPTSTPCAVNETCQGAGVCVVNPCFGVDCSTPPADFCTGDVATRYTGGGECTDGTCGGYPSTTEDCAATGRFCEGNGECVDPCEGVFCFRSPGSPFCDGDVLVTPEAIGECLFGDCQFGDSLTDCSLVGAVCQDGACVEVDPCDGIVCDTPPADRCEGNSSVRYGAGSCADGTCSYESTSVPCEPNEVCQGEGICVVDPCFGVDCSMPPMDFCTGDVATRFTGGGTCTGGACGGYPTEEENCASTGRVCLGQGQCVDLCEGVTCDSPPADTCDGNSAVRYGAGSCAGGTCNYTPTVIACGEGRTCEGAGVCVDDPCAGVDCSVPPADFCDGSLAVRYTGAGACTGGVCDGYPTASEDCALSGRVCEGEGVCVDPCAGVVCDTPPKDFCAGDSAVRYELVGECSAGFCAYDSTTTPCPVGEICAGQGVCTADVCFEVDCSMPPLDFCTGDVATRYLGGGECADGICVGFPTEEEDCSLTGRSCTGFGVCADLCEGVDCSTPPKDFCTGDVATRYTGGGVCADGACIDFPTSTEDCAATGRVCEGQGVCADPCEGVVCDSPPADFCTGNTATRYSGACAGGDCVYTPTSTPCAANELCEGAGVCVANPCFGVDCSTPPADFCTGDVATRYTGGGTCTDGTCGGYPSTTENCAATGRVCEGQGVCADVACEPADCANPATDTCIGNVLTDYDDFGDCVGGTCEFDPAATVDCRNQGRFCVANRCAGGECLDGFCTDPPPNFCDGNVAMQYQNPNGTCAPDGECTYVAPVAEDCTLSGTTCVAGECLSDPCEGVFCGRFEMPYCDGNTRVVPLPDGVCDAGDCIYFEDRTDCTATGLVCQAGACVEGGETCDEAECSVLPPGTCDGNIATSYSGGFCDGPDCLVFPTETDCSLTGRVCSAGTCIFSVCGDAACDSSESCFSCSADCGICPVPANPWIAFSQRADAAYPSPQPGSDQLTFIRADGTGAVELAQNNVFELSPAWTRDGRKLAYRALDSGFASRIFVIDFNAGVRISVSHSFTQIGSITWTRSGNRLVVTGRRSTDAAARVYLVNPSNGQFWPITNVGGGDSATVCSPTQNRCYFIRVSGSTGTLNYVDYNEATPSAAVPTAVTMSNPGAPYTGVAGGQLSVNPDGTRLSFNGLTGDATTRPYFVNLSTNTTSAFPSTANGDAVVYFFPLGTTMTLIRPFPDASPSAELVVADSTGATLLRLTTDSRIQNFAVGSSIESSAIDLAPWTQAIPAPL